jgi:hypothetical protein
MKPWASLECVSELHHFSDASERGFGSCTYLRSISQAGDVYVSLVLSKAKVSPMKKVTIPRLELEAALLSVKADVMLRSQLDLVLLDSVFWVDSQIVLAYINSPSRRFRTFVANRVAAIQTHTEPSQWRYIRSSDNPADLLSRGGTISPPWFAGPDFLRHHKSTWKPYVMEVHTANFFLSFQDSLPALEQVLPQSPLDVLISHYSDWSKLKRAVGWMLRLKSFLLKRDCVKSPVLSPAELDAAEQVLISHAQQEYFAEEIRCLEAGRKLKISSPIIKLDQFLDSSNLLRVGGRLRRLNDDVHPVLVSHKHRIARLIVSHFHSLAHLGTEWVVSLIRQRFWVTRVRGVVKSVAVNCVTCRKLFGSPGKQKMADLPRQRIEPYHPPFSFVGVDCFGPLIVRRARSEVKRYGCLFCCFSTRAVHIELLDSLDCDSFVNAFRRFAARRGQPREVFSDNGTNFVAGSKKLSENHGADSVVWHFNPPSASHFGGVWERLIRTVRKVIAGVVPNTARLTDECLRTVLCEVESIVNSRPLTHVSCDPNDPMPLTPNQLIMLNKCPLPPPGSFQEADVYGRRWKCVQHIASEFWHRWIREYLPMLQSRSKWLHATLPIVVGDIVLIAGESSPRGVWRLAKVLEVRESLDGLVRSVRLRLKNGHEVLRPVSKCVKLESSLD